MSHAPPSCQDPCPIPPRIPCPETPKPPALTKPLMRGLHLAQTKKNLAIGLALSCFSGACVYFFIGRPRRQAYKEYFEKAELDNMVDEMARKGLFQSVPKQLLEEYKK